MNRTKLFDEIYFKGFLLNVSPSHTKILKTKPFVNNNLSWIDFEVCYKYAFHPVNRSFVMVFYTLWNKVL